MVSPQHVKAVETPLHPAESGDDQEALPHASSEGSTAIAQRLQRAILSGHYLRGEKLPPERELATYFGVARSTIREALRHLEELDLLSRRIGSGTFVNHSIVPDAYVMAQRTSPIELIEARLAVEPHLIRLAAIHATGQDLDQLAEALEALERVAADPEAFSKADERFHLLIADCSRNSLMVWLYKHINDIRGNTAWRAMKDNVLSAERIAAYNAQHRALYQALRSRDVEGAAKTMRAHLEKARQDLLGAGVS